MNVALVVEKPFSVSRYQAGTPCASIYSMVLFFPSHLSWNTQLCSANQCKHLIHSDCDESVYLLASVCGDSQAIGHKSRCFVLLHQPHRNNRDSHLDGKWHKNNTYKETLKFDEANLMNDNEKIIGKINHQCDLSKWWQGRHCNTLRKTPWESQSVDIKCVQFQSEFEECSLNKQLIVTQISAEVWFQENEVKGTMHSIKEKIT